MYLRLTGRMRVAASVAPPAAAPASVATSAAAAAAVAYSTRNAGVCVRLTAAANDKAKANTKIALAAC